MIAESAKTLSGRNKRNGTMNYAFRLLRNYGPNAVKKAFNKGKFGDFRNDEAPQNA